MSRPQTPKKYSVSIAGHATSFSLEPAFMDELKRIAAARGQSLAQLVASIDAARSGNLSSALRLLVLEELRAALAKPHVPPRFNSTNP